MPDLADKLLIRRATLTDVPQLCELLTLLFAQEADFAPDPERQTRALNLIIGQILPSGTLSTVRQPERLSHGHGQHPVYRQHR